MVSYQALFEPAVEGGFVVTFPDLNHGATQGETEEEAMEMARDFLAAVVSDYLEDDAALPDPKKYRGKKYRAVRLPALIGMKVELYRAFSESGIRKSELARRLKISKGNIDRLFDFKHISRLDQIESAFHAIGKRLSVEVHDEAA